MTSQSQNGNFFFMNKFSQRIRRSLSKEEIKLNETSEMRRVLAQLEATLSMKENQKVTEKSQKR